MRATSRAQFDAMLRRTIPDLERVRDDVWALPTPVPTGATLYALCYLLRDSDGGIHVVDPGWASDDNWGALRFALKKIGAAMTDVRSIVLTHLHSDHTGLAPRLRAASGAPIVMHEREQATLDGVLAGTRSEPDLESWGVPEHRRRELLDALDASARIAVFHADVLVGDGDLLDVPGRELRVVHTPGHTMGSICLVDEAGALILTGDAVLPTSRPSLGRGGFTDRVNPLALHLDSLDRLARFDDCEVCPGHGYRFMGIASCIAQARHGYDVATTAVESVLDEHPRATVWQLAERRQMHPPFDRSRGYYLLSALTETAMLADRARSRVSRGGGG